MQHINIRLAESTDTSDILEIYTPHILEAATSFELEVPTVTDFYSRITEVLKTAPWLVCSIDDKIVGYAYASNHRNRAAYQWSKEVSVYVHTDYLKRKIATALYSCLFDILKLQGFTNLLAGISLPNPASIAFHESFGFKQIGVYHNIGYKLGKYRDVSWSEKFIGQVDQAPQPIKDLSEIVQTDEWASIIDKAVRMIK